MNKSGKILIYGSLFSTLYITTSVFIYKDTLIDKRKTAHQNPIEIITPKEQKNSLIEESPKVETPPPKDREQIEEINIAKVEEVQPKVTDREDIKLKQIQNQISDIIKSHRITFYRGSRHITLSSKKTLKRVAKLIDEIPDAKVIVKGYTDASGGATANKTLSLKRAKVVKRYLEQLGVESERIEAIGFGEENLIDTKNPNSPINRRVEIEVRR